MKTKEEARAARKRRIRKKISGTTARPRLSVFRSLNHTYAQVVDDSTGTTLATASSREKSIDGKDKSEKAKSVGELVAKRCAECDLDLAPHDSGDGPAVFVIFLLGAIVIPFVFAFERLVEPPMWAHMVVWPPVVIVGAIALLRPMKATLVALHYKNLRHEYDGTE